MPPRCVRVWVYERMCGLRVCMPPRCVRVWVYERMCGLRVCVRRICITSRDCCVETIQLKKIAGVATPSVCIHLAATLCERPLDKVCTPPVLGTRFRVNLLATSFEHTMHQRRSSVCIHRNSCQEPDGPCRVVLPRTKPFLADGC